MFHNFFQKIQPILSIVEKIVVFSFAFDIYMLGLFQKTPLYIFYIFSFIFGNFGWNSQYTPTVLLSKYLCLYLSLFLISTSFTTFLAFQIPPIKEYLYKALGKDWITKNIGNPGWEPLVKYGGIAFAGYAMDSGLRFGDAYVHSKVERDNLNALIKSIDESPMTQRQKEIACENACKAFSKSTFGYIPKSPFDVIYQHEKGIAREKGFWHTLGKSLHLIDKDKGK